MGAVCFTCFSLQRESQLSIFINSLINEWMYFRGLTFLHYKSLFDWSNVISFQEYSRLILCARIWNKWFNLNETMKKNYLSTVQLTVYTVNREPLKQLWFCKIFYNMCASCFQNTLQVKMESQRFICYIHVLYNLILYEL